jgi:hypothetical protein
MGFSGSSFVLVLEIFTKTILDSFNSLSFVTTLYQNNRRKNKMKNGTKNLQKLLRSRKSTMILYEKPNIRYSSRFVNRNVID